MFDLVYHPFHASVLLANQPKGLAFKINSTNANKKTLAF